MLLCGETALCLTTERDAVAVGAVETNRFFVPAFQRGPPNNNCRRYSCRNDLAKASDNACKRRVDGWTRNANEAKGQKSDNGWSMNCQCR